MLLIKVSSHRLVVEWNQWAREWKKLCLNQSLRLSRRLCRTVSLGKIQSNWICIRRNKYFLINNLIQSFNKVRVNVLSKLFKSSRHMKKGVTVDYNTTNLPINPNDRTFFICHGFTSESNTTDYFSLISTILDRYSVLVEF